MMRFRAFTAALAFGFLALAGRADAALVLTIQPATAAPGSQGFFDVFLSGDSGGLQVIGYDIKLDLPAGSDVTFASSAGPGDAKVTTATSAPDGYIFGVPGGSFVPTLSAAGKSVSYGDSGVSPLVTLVPPTVYGIGRVFFDVSALAGAGVVPVSFDPAGTQVVLSDFSTLTQGPDLALTPGTITVAPVAVPEPSSLLLLAAAGGIGYVARRRRSRAV